MYTVIHVTSDHIFVEGLFESLDDAINLLRKQLNDFINTENFNQALTNSEDFEKASVLLMECFEQELKYALKYNNEEHLLTFDVYESIIDFVNYDDYIVGIVKIKEI